MDEQSFLNSLPDLTGRIAVVTGGAGGIGLETTIYLAQKGATVYVASRNQEKSERAIATARERLKGQGGPIKFHKLDLASIRSARESARAFRQLEDRLDILVCNAAISMSSLQELSPDGYERAFATNHLGHFAFVMELLDLLEAGAKSTGDARVVMVSSLAYRVAQKPDYDSLRSVVKDDGTRIWDLKGAFIRYGNSKLANIHFASELDSKFRERNIRNIYCNSCHPGSVTTTGLGTGEQVALSPAVIGSIRTVLNRVSNTAQDAAKTQVYLAASKDIIERDVHGEYWVPQWSWTLKYKGCHKEELTSLGQDKQERQRLWQFSEEAVKAAVSESQ